MPSNSSERSIAATEAAEKILGFYPKVTASDPKTFITGLVELLQAYPEHMLRRVASPVRGIPALFKFCPTIQEIKEACDGWVDRQREHERIMGSGAPRIAGPSLPPAKANATASALCERFGIRAIPPGWDAVMVTQQAHIHGAGFRDYVERVLASPDVTVPQSLPARVVAAAKAEMERRTGEAAE